MISKINKDLLPFKLHYFFKSGGLAFLPMLSALCRQKGLSDQAVGIIWTVTPISTSALNIVFGAIADAYKLHRALLLFTCTLLSVFATGFFFIPSISGNVSPPVNASLSVQCEPNSRFIAICPHNDNLNDTSSKLSPLCSFDLNSTITAEECSIECSHVSIPLNVNLGKEDGVKEATTSVTNEFFSFQLVDICNEETCFQILDDSFLPSVKRECGTEINVACNHFCEKHYLSMTYLVQNTGYWIIFFFVIMISGTLHTSATLANTMCFVVLGKNRHKFGQQKLFGSMSIGVMGLVGGALVNYCSKGHLKTNYNPAIVITATFLTINLLVTTKIKVEVPGKQSEGSSVRDVIYTFNFIRLMVTVAVVGLSFGVVWTFGYIYIEDVALAWDASFDDIKLLQGLVLFVDCFIGELPFFFFSSYIIKKLTPVHTFSLTLSALSLRIFLLSIVSNPWLFLPIHLLHGLSFGVFYANMIAFASLIAPKGAQATLQSIVFTSFTLGKSLGALGGGQLLQSIGGSKTFLILGLLVSSYTIVYVIISCVIQKKKYNPAPDDERGEYKNPNLQKDADANESDVINQCIFESQSQLDALA